MAQDLGERYDHDEAIGNPFYRRSLYIYISTLENQRYHGWLSPVSAARKLALLSIDGVRSRLPRVLLIKLPQTIRLACARIRPMIRCRGSGQKRQSSLTTDTCLRDGYVTSTTISLPLFDSSTTLSTFSTSFFSNTSPYPSRHPWCNHVVHFTR